MHARRNGVSTELGPALLFCPADRPDRFGKAAAAASAVILDLEDGVRADNKDTARAAVRAHGLDPTRTVVRVSAVGAPEHAADMAAVNATDLRVVMLAKSESRAQVESLAPHPVVALCETPLGILNAREIAAAGNTVAMMWGAEDLVAAIGGRSSRLADGGYADVARHSRSLVLLAASSCGRAAVDSVYLDIPDLAGLRAEAVAAATVGFAAKACIHPSQVRTVIEAFAPTTADVAWATRVVEAAVDEAGVFALDGQMVDAPVVARARHILDHPSVRLTSE
jgi:citrate lyase subunit beta/citryl-CoA lyase